MKKEIKKKVKHQVVKEKSFFETWGVYLAVLVIMIIGFFVLKPYIFDSNTVLPPGALDNFANCVNTNGAIMFGTDTCPHCTSQKELFGTSFQYINFIECTTNAAFCQSEGIEGYPTWKFKDGSVLMGAQDLITLGKKTGCSLTVTQ